MAVEAISKTSSTANASTKSAGRPADRALRDELPSPSDAISGAISRLIPARGEAHLSKHCPNPDCAALLRDGCVAEFEDSIECCIDCGARLVPGEVLTDAEAGFEYNELRTVFIADNVVQGHLVAGTIEAEGIPVYLKGELLQGAVGELSADVRQVEVQVPFERFERAREIALRFEGRSD